VSSDDKKVWQYKLPSVKGEGWALILLREDGFFAAVSDYGNYAHFWSAHGCDDFRKFFLRIEPDYICGKLGSRTLDSEASFENLKAHIEEQKKEGRLSAREAQQRLEHISGFSNSAWEEFLYDSDTQELFEMAYEYSVRTYPSDVTAFAKTIVCKRLREAIQKELEEESAANHSSV
jgi:hypothetical protein